MAIKKGGVATAFCFLCAPNMGVRFATMRFAGGLKVKKGGGWSNFQAIKESVNPLKE